MPSNRSSWLRIALSICQTDCQRLSSASACSGEAVDGTTTGRDHIAELLAGRLAHDTSDRLDDLNLTLAWVHEEDAVESRDIDALGKAAGVREYPGLAFGCLIEEGQRIAPSRGR